MFVIKNSNLKKKKYIQNFVINSHNLDLIQLFFKINISKFK